MVPEVVGQFTTKLIKFFVVKGYYTRESNPTTCLMGSDPRPDPWGLDPTEK